MKLKDIKFQINRIKDGKVLHTSNGDVAWYVSMASVPNGGIQFKDWDWDSAKVTIENNTEYEKGFRDCISTFELWLLESQVMFSTPDFERLMSMLNRKLKKG